MPETGHETNALGFGRSRFVNDTRLVSAKYNDLLCLGTTLFCFFSAQLGKRPCRRACD